MHLSLQELLGSGRAVQIEHLAERALTHTGSGANFWVLGTMAVLCWQRSFEFEGGRSSMAIEFKGSHHPKPVILYAVVLWR